MGGGSEQVSLRILQSLDGRPGLRVIQNASLQQVERHVHPVHPRRQRHVRIYRADYPPHHTTPHNPLGSKH